MEFPHTALLWKTEIFTLDHRKKISSNQLFSNFFSKTVTFTKFLPKKYVSRFFCHSDFTWNHLQLFSKTFVKVTVLLKKLLNSWFDEIFFWLERMSRFSTLCSNTFLTFSWKYVDFLKIFFVKSITNKVL